MAWTRRSDGDFHPTRTSPDELQRRQRRIIDQPWTMLDQCHGSDIVRIDQPGDGTGCRADGAITELCDVALAVWVGDCAPIVMVGSNREFAVVHAGWRGLASGVVDAAVSAFAESIELAILGPVICGACYEFGQHDLSVVAAAVGIDAAALATTTRTGSVGLDMTRAVEVALGAHGIETVTVGGCPGCSEDAGFSHRVRSERERHAMVAWQVCA